MSAGRLRDQVIGHTGAWSRFDFAFKHGRLPGSWLFVGPEGVGKSLVAKALAQALVCESIAESDGAMACGECASCRRIAKQQSESVEWLSADGAQIKLEPVRLLLDRLSLKPLGRRRVVIIDQAQLLNPQAANALLKTLEEPPEKTHFLLLTPEAGGLLPTIRSRCQAVRFSPLKDDELQRALTTLGFHLEDAGQVRRARGSVGRALEILAQGEDALRMASKFEAWMHELIKVPSTGREWDQTVVLKDLVAEEPSQAKRLSHLVLHVIRDGLEERIKRGGTSAATSPDLAWRQRDWVELEGLAEQALQLETDLTRGFDRQLVLEELTRGLRGPQAQRE